LSVASASVATSANTSVSASFASTASLALTASYISNVVSSSFAVSSSTAVTSSFAFSASVSVSSSFAVSASYAQNAGLLNSLSSSQFAQLVANNTFTGNNIFGNVTASNALITSASVQNLTVVYETASVIYSSGSNQFGDAANDVQTLWGTVDIKTGPVLVTGSLNVSSSTRLQQLTASGLNYPTADGTVEQFLSTNGAGTLSFANVRTLYQNIRNREAVAITKGAPLFVSGSTGDNADVYLADAANPLRMPASLIAGDTTLAAGATGRGIILGHIEGVDTTGYPAGTLVYVAGGGGWTSVAPTGSAQVQPLGVVTRTGTNGMGIVLTVPPNSLPNIQSGYTWVGDANGVPQAVATSSIQNVVSASFATTASFYGGSVVSASYAISASLSQTALNATSASFASTASFYGGSVVSASFASTASSVNALNQNVIITGSVSASANIVAEGNIRAFLVDTNYIRNDAGPGGELLINSPNSTLTLSTFGSSGLTRPINLVASEIRSTGSFNISGSVNVNGSTNKITGSVGITGSVNIDNSQVQILGPGVPVGLNYVSGTNIVLEVVGENVSEFEVYANASLDAFNVHVDQSGSAIRDLNGLSFTYVPWIQIPSNVGGSNPRPFMPRGLVISGSTLLEGNNAFPLFVSGTIQTQRMHYMGNPFNNSGSSNLGVSPVAGPVINTLFWNHVPTF